MSSLLTLLVLAILIWITAGAFWVKLSGLARLAAEYPDQPEEPLAKVYSGYGQLGSVNTAFAVLSGCSTGLRIEASRWLIPWGKAAFIPWDGVIFEDVEPTALGWPAEQVRARFLGVPDVSLTLPPEHFRRLSALCPSDKKCRVR